ncbi:DinB family protein [Bacillus rhizoplanae]|uniref:DinB family protein n=1 Tax=Bacillus rhizoplanae TaxID=2880966 RepID=UPI003D1D9010
MKHPALQTYDYHVWANKRLFEHLKTLPTDVWSTEVQSVFPSISQTFVHMYITDTIWLHTLSDKTFDEVKASAIQLSEKIKGTSMEEMEQLFLNSSEDYQAFFAHQENLDKTVSPKHPQFGQLETNIFELIQHVVNHGTYHRGNITAMLRQLGYTGTPTDYIFYLYAMSNSKK